MNQSTRGRLILLASLLPGTLHAGDWAQPIMSPGSTVSGAAATPGWHLGFDPLTFAPSTGGGGGTLLGTATYMHQFESDFDKLPGELSVNDASIMFPLLPLSNGRLRILTMLSYRATWFNTTAPSLIPEDHLHAVRLPVAVMFDLSDKWLVGGMVMPGYSGDGSDFGDGFSINAALGAGYNYSESLKLFGGVFYSHGFDDELLVPGVGFLWKPNPQWSAFLLPPFAGVTYEVNEDWKIGLTGRYDSATWNVEADAAGPDRDVKVSSVRVGLKVERRISEQFWAFVAGGIVMARELDVETPSGASLVEDDIDTGGYVQAGLNLRF